MHLFYRVFPFSILNDFQSARYTPEMKTTSTEVRVSECIWVFNVYLRSMYLSTLEILTFPNDFPKSPNTDIPDSFLQWLIINWRVRWRGLWCLWGFSYHNLLGQKPLARETGSFLELANACHVSMTHIQFSTSGSELDRAAWYSAAGSYARRVRGQRTVRSSKRTQGKIGSARMLPAEESGVCLWETTCRGPGEHAPLGVSRGPRMGPQTPCCEPPFITY